MDRHRRLIDQNVENEQLEFDKAALLDQKDVQRADDLICDDKRKTSGDLKRGVCGDRRMQIEVAFFVRKDAPALCDRALAHSIAARHVIIERGQVFARGNARRDVEGSTRLIVRIDHGAGAWDDLHRALDDQAERRIDARIIARANAIDRCADRMQI
jgi:hypothetical protein